MAKIIVPIGDRGRLSKIDVAFPWNCQTSAFVIEVPIYEVGEEEKNKLHELNFGIGEDNFTSVELDTSYKACSGIHF